MDKLTDLEILRFGTESRRGQALMDAMTQINLSAIGFRGHATRAYHGGYDWLCLYGAGGLAQNDARNKQLRAKGRVACWDIGYLCKTSGPDCFMRVSIDHNHPSVAYMERTDPDPKRWNVLKLSLRDDYDPNGPVVVAGMGHKSREHLRIRDWELKALESAKARFPDKRVLYRPKPGDRNPVEGYEYIGENLSIEYVLKGASLVICRHSNVAIDACIAGVPVECEDGAAFWLYRKNSHPDVAARRDFLYRLAWWQWRITELTDAWKFLLRVSS